jgi:hypothetical protein
MLPPLFTLLFIAFGTDKSKYNNRLITKLINIFFDVEERRKEKKEGLTLIQALS